MRQRRLQTTGLILAALAGVTGLFLTTSQTSSRSPVSAIAESPYTSTAAQCVRAYARTDGKADAQRDVANGELRLFFTWQILESGPHIIVPGVNAPDDRFPTVEFEPQIREPLYLSRPDRECEAARLEYLRIYNQHMVAALRQKMS